MTNFSPIRPATDADVPYLYEICLKTGHTGGDATSFFQNPYMLGSYWAAPYLHFNKELCFIAENKDGRPAGYIVGTRDTAQYNNWLAQNWLPILQRHYAYLEPKNEKEKNLLAQIQKQTVGAGVWENIGYPAHLHIDLLPELQGQGMGRRLIEAWLEKAKELRVAGVHLGVSAHNTGAIGFYQHLGFSILETKEHSITFGMKLHLKNSGSTIAE